jgi:hypothetical protein
MALNPDVTPETISRTICVSGWTATVRPPVSYTNKIKRQLMDAEGIPWERASELELDHAVNLGVGGSPTSPDNLRLQTWAKESEWPQIDSDAHGKDAIEAFLQRAVCRSELPLAEAQTCIYSDWRACAEKHLKGRTK